MSDFIEGVIAGAKEAERQRIAAAVRERRESVGSVTYIGDRYRVTELDWVLTLLDAEGAR